MTVPWLVRRRAGPPASLALVCLPHAGGGTAAFHALAARLPAWIEPVPVQIPGRERRVNERALLCMDELVTALDEALERELARRFALFGHSLGGLVAFELARRRRREGRRAPVHVFVSACRAPARAAHRAPIHALPPAEFRAQVAAIGGIPPEVLAHEELMELVLPALRADFELYETYRFDDTTPLDLPLTAIAAARDEYVTRDEVLAWRTATSASFEMCDVDGDHFLLASAPDAVARIVATRLAAHAEVSA